MYGFVSIEGRSMCETRDTLTHIELSKYVGIGGERMNLLQRMFFYLELHTNPDKRQRDRDLAADGQSALEACTPRTLVPYRKNK